MCLTQPWSQRETSWRSWWLREVLKEKSSAGGGSSMTQACTAEGLANEQSRQPEGSMGWGP